MKTAQLILRTETELYLNEKGELLNLNPTEKMAHIILGKKTKTLKTEEVVCRFRGKNNKELDIQFWNYMESEKLDATNYFMVIDTN